MISDEWQKITDTQGHTFYWRVCPDGDIEIGATVHSFVLTVDHIAWMYQASQEAAKEWIEQHNDSDIHPDPRSPFWHRS